MYARADMHERVRVTRAMPGEIELEGLPTDAVSGKRQGPDANQGDSETRNAK